MAPRRVSAAVTRDRSASTVLVSRDRWEAEHNAHLPGRACRNRSSVPRHTAPSDSKMPVHSSWPRARWESSVLEVVDSQSCFNGRSRAASGPILRKVVPPSLIKPDGRRKRVGLQDQVLQAGLRLHDGRRLVHGAKKTTSARRTSKDRSRPSAVDISTATSLPAA